MPTMPSGFYNHHNPAKNYEKLLFLAGKGLQSAEFNALQDSLMAQQAEFASALLKDGDLIEGCACILDTLTGATTLEAGKVFIRGRVYPVEAKEFFSAVSGVVDIGVWLSELVITELEDPSLRNPAVGTRGEGEPGAARLKTTLEWGLATDNHTGNFYPVYKAENGVLKIKTPPPQLDSVTTALARYDRESNGGNYVVSGLGLIYITHDLTNNNQVFSIGEGKAHVSGYEIELQAALRKAFAYDPDLQTIVSEPHVFEDSGDGTMRVDLNYFPLHDIQQIEIGRAHV